jgi:hypothetical protein
MQHFLVPLEPSSGVVTLNARASQDCQGAFAQGVLDDRRLSSSNLREHPKLAPRASDGLGTRWSPSYSSVIALRAEANIVRVILNRGKAINERKMQQMKYAEK